MLIDSQGPQRPRGHDLSSQQCVGSGTEAWVLDYDFPSLRTTLLSHLPHTHTHQLPTLDSGVQHSEANQPLCTSLWLKYFIPLLTTEAPVLMARESIHPSPTCRVPPTKTVTWTSCSASGWLSLVTYKLGVAPDVTLQEGGWDLGRAFQTVLLWLWLAPSACRAGSRLLLLPPHRHPCPEGGILLVFSC